MSSSKMIVSVLALSFSLLAGCGKKDDDKMDEASKFLLESVQKDIGRTKDALKKGQDARFICAGAGSYADDLTKDKVKAAEAAVKELAGLCNYDVPLAALDAATKKAEDARKAKPDANPLAECFDANHDMAVEDLKKNGFDKDAKVKALDDRWAAACPPEKPDAQ